MRRAIPDLRRLILILGVGLTVCGLGQTSLIAQPPADASAGLDSYVAGVEARLARQHRSGAEFLAGTRDGEGRADEEQIRIERIEVPGALQVSGAMIHHWRATGFVPGASAEDFERLLRNLPAYTRVFAPQVAQARLLRNDGDRIETFTRLKEQHVITVWMDVNYEVTFGQLDPRHRYAISRSRKVREMTGVGTQMERALGPAEEHGWLWRMNTYWSYEEVNGGVYLQVESVSLTRSVPRGLGWIVDPYVQSIPRDSLEFTLRAVCRALEK